MSLYLHNYEFLLSLLSTRQFRICQNTNVKTQNESKYLFVTKKRKKSMSKYNA